MARTRKPASRPYSSRFKTGSGRFVEERVKELAAERRRAERTAAARSRSKAVRRAAAQRASRISANIRAYEAHGVSAATYQRRESVARLRERVIAHLDTLIPGGQWDYLGILNPAGLRRLLGMSEAEIKTVARLPPAEAAEEFGFDEDEEPSVNPLWYHGRAQEYGVAA